MPKRGENIYKRRDGRWEGRYISGREEDGKAVYKSVYGRSYKDVKNRLEKEKTTSIEKLPPAGQVTVSVLCLQWLEHVRSTVKESTFARYKLLTDKHIIPALGDIQGDRLTLNILSQFVNDKLEHGRLDGGGGLSPKSVQDIVIVLKAIMKLAGLQYGMADYAAHLKLPKAPKPDIAVLSNKEIGLIESECLQVKDNRSMGILLCLYTGIRLGEACAVRWSDINWEESTLRVRKTVVRLPRQSGDSEAKTRLTITNPKTKNADRIVPLPAWLAEELKILAEEQESDAYILTGESSRFMDPRTYQYRFKSLLKRLGFKDAKFHILRHTFATMCLRAGVDIKTLSEVLGHSKIQLTLELYVHSSTEAKKTQMANLHFPSRKKSDFSGNNS